MRKLLILFAAIQISFAAYAQDFTGCWTLQATGLPYDDGKLGLTVNYENGVYTGILDQGNGSNVELSYLIVKDKHLSAQYDAMGFKVTITLDLLEDDTLEGSIMGMYDLKGNRAKDKVTSEEKVFQPVSATELAGIWYGLYCGSPLTLTVDDRIHLAAESFSSMNMTYNYNLTEGTPSRISLTGADSGMDGEGICTLDNGTLDMLIIFGAPGQVTAPKSFADGVGNVAAARLTLCRDKNLIERAVTQVNAPELAELAFERNRRIGSGININATLDGLFGDKPLKKDAIKGIAEQGFNNVRIPIRWSEHTSKSDPYTIDPAFFRKVDAIVEECLDNGLAVVIDNHYYPFISFGQDLGNLSYQKNIDRFYCIWQQISTHYKDYSNEMLFFELMNEPSLQLDPTLWNEMIASSIKIIRHDNPDRTIIVSTPSLGQHWTIGLLEFPSDEWNLIVDVHYYLPQTFTHQGLSYAMAGAIKDIPWSGSEADKAPLEYDFSFLAAWSKRNCRPVYIGEYGVCSNADDSSRALYMSFITDLINKNGFSNSLWAYHRDTFGIYDESNGKWNNSILKSLKVK